MAKKREKGTGPLQRPQKTFDRADFAVPCSRLHSSQGSYDSKYMGNLLSRGNTKHDSENPRGDQTTPA